MSDYDRSGPLDSAIDEAVRDMMLVDPRPGLRQRVTRSIDSQSRRPRRISVRFASAAALAVVALASLAALVWLRVPQADLPPAAPQMVATPSAAPRIPPPEPAATEPVRPAQPRTARRRAPAPEAIFGPQNARVTAASVPAADRPVADAAAPEVEPPLAGLRPQIPPITVTPLRIAPLTIAPLQLDPLPVRR